MVGRSLGECWDGEGPQEDSREGEVSEKMEWGLKGTLRWGQKVPREELGRESSCDGGEVVGSRKVPGSGVGWRGSLGRWWDGTGPWEGRGVKRVPWRMER